MILTGKSEGLGHQAADGNKGIGCYLGRNPM
jgi:hypothetical protein